MLLKKTYINLALIGSAAFLFSGCATLLGGGGSQNITINSNQPTEGVLKYEDGSGVQYFTAPATLKVDRRSKDIIIESRNGEFNPVNVESEMNPWFWGNIIFGGVIGSTTDSISGAAWEYDDKPVTISVSKKTPSF